MKNFQDDFRKVEQYFAYRHVYFAHQHLKECLKEEVQRDNSPFSWFRTLHRAHCHPSRRFYFWLRIWGYLYQTNRLFLRPFARFQMYSLNLRHKTDISPGAKIGPGLKLKRIKEIIVREGALIGRNATIYQGVTIGIKDNSKQGYLTIGDNVTIGDNSCIIGNLKIGNDVTIMSMSLVIEDVGDNATVYPKNTLMLKS